jgi:hypothetical protein
LLEAAMNITSPLSKGASEVAESPGDSVTSIMKAVGDWAGLLDDDPDGRLGMLISGLTGAAAALAVAIVLSFYLRNERRTWREMIRHGVAAIVALTLLAFIAYDMRPAALAYLGINPSKPAVGLEIRKPKAALLAISDTQGELRGGELLL